MRFKLILLAIVLLLVGGTVIVAWLMSSEPGDVGPVALNSGKDDGFTARRSSEDLSSRISELRKSRGGLPAELAAEAALDQEAKAYWQRTLELQNKSPLQAAEEARTKLSELEQQIASETDPATRARLQKRRDLVLTVLSRLEKMNNR